MKEIRRRMEKGDSLYFANEKPEIRRCLLAPVRQLSLPGQPGQISMVSKLPAAPGPAGPDARSGDKVYQQYFGEMPARGTSASD